MNPACSPIAVRAHFKGFTLIEMLLVAALLAVLLALALPQYRSYVLRSQRVEAIRMLTTAATCQERLRASNGAYDTTMCQPLSANEYYQLIIEPIAVESSDRYTLIADRIEPDVHESCGSLTLDQTGTRGISGPQENLWKCWSGR